MNPLISSVHVSLFGSKNDHHACTYYINYVKDNELMNFNFNHE